MQGGDSILNEFSDIEGAMRWQLIVFCFSEEQSIKLYNLVKEYSVKMPNISVENATSNLMTAMPEVFVRGRDIDIFEQSDSNQGK